MLANELAPRHASKGPKRVGRGGKKGTYSGRGNKGQSARAGRKMVPMIREMIKRYPKLKGYRRFEMENTTTVVNLEVLEAKYQDGETVSPETLAAKHVISATKSGMPKVKILGEGKLAKKLNIENCSLSKSAKAAVEKAGGSIK